MKLLIVRFSSYGDIVQALSVPRAFIQAHGNTEVHWLVRSDGAVLLEGHPHIHKIIRLDRTQGLLELLRLAWQIGTQGGYTHIYDAHNNLRSNILALIWSTIKTGRRLLGRPTWLFTQRPKYRLRRWLFFRLRWRVLPQPFKGAESYLWPLEKWGVSSFISDKPDCYPSPQTSLPADFPPTLSYIAIAPSAAWPTKRWPLDHWKRFIELTHFSIVVLGGPEDLFCEELKKIAPERVQNWAGRLSLQQSALALSLARVVISGDTGLLHIADQMNKPTLALIGPTAFGYPSRSSSHVLEVSLWCKPCSKDGRDRCRNPVYQKCLRDISPERVAQAATELWNAQK